MRDVLPFVVTFLMAWLSADLLVPLVRRFAYAIGKVDKPGTRKIHKDPIPRLGGIAIFLGCFVSLFILDLLKPGFFYQLPPQWKGLLAGGSIIFLVGLLDDLYDLRPRVKLLGQIIAASVAFALGVKIVLITNPLGGMLLFPEWLSFILTVGWLVAITNTVNLIDGLDGLAAGASPFL